MKGLRVAVGLAVLLSLAAAARAYESKDVEEMPRAAPGRPDAPVATQPPGEGARSSEASGSPTQDEWAKNEIALLVIATIVDGKRGYPLDLARVTAQRPGGRVREIARTGVTGRVRARFEMHDPPPKGSGSGGSGGSAQVVVRVERPGYLPYEGTFSPGSLPKKGRYALMDLGELRLRRVPLEEESP